MTTMNGTFTLVTVGASLAPSDAALLADLLAAPASLPASVWETPSALPSPAWATPVRLRPVSARCRTSPPWATVRRAAGRPLAVAAALLLAGGIAASSSGAAPARAAGVVTPVGAASASVAPLVVSASASRAVAAPASVAPLIVSASASRAVAAPASVAPVAASASAAPVSARGAVLDGGLSEGSVVVSQAADTGADRALLAALLTSELAAPAPIAPAVSFATVARLPAAALAVPAVAAHTLPMISLADNIIPPPPPPPSTVIAQGQQPPPPAGYVQPPGYQDGVPFGGQIGAVPGSSASRSSTARTSTTRLVASVYVVRAGDTLSSIALRVYGDARRAPSIWEANYRLIGADPNRIFPGQRLTMPGLTTRAVVRPAELLPIRGSIAQQANYTIQPRDFLRWMAERAYGNEVFWPEIFRANRNVLGPNPDLIYPGVTVYIP